MTCKDLPTPVASVRGIKAYDPDRSLCPTDLRLDGNEGMMPSSKILRNLADMDSSTLRCYPDRQRLEKKLAGRWNLEGKNILVTAGADDALDRICRAFLDESRNLVVATPTFEMIPRYARLAGALVNEVPWNGESFPVNGILDCVDSDTGVIAVVSPNNPTGAVITPAELSKISAAAPGALLLVDMAYGEFSDIDLMPTVLKLPNALGVRSMSKAWGLAGLRVGYVAGPSSLISILKIAGGPYAVSGPSLVLAYEALDEQARVDEFVIRIRDERSTLQNDLEDLGGLTTASQGNFAYAKFQNPRWVRDGLAGTGIAVRLLGKDTIPGPIRISCPGNREEFQRLRQSLKTVLAPEALLLDMDGVLADVRESYHQSIIETAKSFNIELTSTDISVGKRKPGSNNDWILTQQLMTSRGVLVELENIINRFQEIYFNLSWNEKLIPPPEYLQRLASQMPLAIVTGRPRQEAEMFLERQKIGGLFKVIICLEDGPDKPDPITVKLAMKQLGVTQAWMVGDTVNDMVAARAGNVLPLGIVPPGESFSRSAPLLTQAGAGRVLNNLTDLEEVLPK